jgi:hypothetical protein
MARQEEAARLLGPKGPVEEEGGWRGWAVVLASFLCILVLDGIGYSFGVSLHAGPLPDPLLETTAPTKIWSYCPFLRTEIKKLIKRACQR